MSPAVRGCAAGRAAGARRTIDIGLLDEAHAPAPGDPVVGAQGIRTVHDDPSRAHEALDALTGERRATEDPLAEEGSW